jgi:hypothetical protein
MVKDTQADGYPLLSAGNRQLEVILDNAGLFFHGVVWSIQEDGGEDMCYSQVQCWDPMMLWRWRPARDLVDSYSGEAGNLSDPSFLSRNKFGGLITEEILLASENQTLIPAEAEGQLWIDLANSTFHSTGARLDGAPTNWPMTIAEILTLLTNTGELDLILVPIVGGVGPDGFQNMATIHTYPGNYGNNLTSSVHFDYATGDFNARLLRRSEDMETIGNKIFYYLGPRLDQQHWRSNVTGDHPDLPYPPGGSTTLLLSPGNALGNAIVESRDRYGVFMLNNIYDNFGSGSSTEGSESSAYPLFLRQWQIEGVIRLGPRKMAYITPVRDGEFGVGDFDIGDVITVNIGADTNGARVEESGEQRIYQYTVDIDDDGVEALGEFVTSPDQDSI